MKQGKSNKLKDPERAARLEHIRKQLHALVDEYQVSYFCLVITPTIVEDAGELDLIKEEEVFLAGHGPKEHLLNTMTQQLANIDDGCGKQKGARK